MKRTVVVLTGAALLFVAAIVAWQHGGLARIVQSSSPDSSGATQTTNSREPAGAAPGGAVSPAASSIPAPVSSSDPPPSPAELQDALATLKSSIDYSVVEPKARQAKIGSDPQAIWRFVQSEIRFEPYTGALRGASGTLQARAGNSLDRALLAAAMLRAAGLHVRFAEGTLSAGQADKLVRAAFPGRTPVFKGDSPEMAITRRALSHFLYLGNTLHAGQFTAPQNDAGAWERALKDAAQHFWVQVDSGGRWVDADPSPGVAYGQSLTAAASTKDDPDAKLFHTVDIRVEVETVHDGKRQTRSVLQYGGRAADLAGLPIGLFHEKNGDAYTPVLMAGEKVMKGEAIQMPPVIGMGAARAPVLNPFATGTDRTSAEWLRFRIDGPAGAREAAYTIVDTEGAAARQSGAAPKDISAENLGVVSAAFETFVGVGISTGSVSPASLAARMADLTDPLSDAGLVRMLSLTALSYQAVRGQLPSSFLTPRPLQYIDTPSVVVARARAGADDSVATLSLDLTLKGYRLLRTPDDPFGGRAPFYDYLAAGVLDHTTERWLIGAAQAGGSVGALFEAAVEQKVPARVVTAAAQIPDAALTPDGRLRLSDAVDKGQVAVLPSGRPGDWKPMLGWWNIDRATGWTEDTTEDGGHQASSEYSQNVKRVAVPASERYAILGCRVAGAALLASSYFIFKVGLDSMGSATDQVSALQSGAGYAAGSYAAAGAGMAMLYACRSGPTPPAEPTPPSGGPPAAGPRGPVYGTVRNPPVRMDPRVYLPTEPGLPYAPTVPEGGAWPTQPGITDTIPEMGTLPWI